MDFLADQLFDGRKLRVLTLIDNFSRQCLDVVKVLEDLKFNQHIVPKRIQVDIGSEFISKDLDS